MSGEAVEGARTTHVSAAARRGPERDLSPYISIDPHMQGGAPCISGTRVTVDVIAALIGECTDEEIIGFYPSLRPEDVQVVRWFAERYDYRIVRRRRCLTEAFR